MKFSLYLNINFQKFALFTSSGIAPVLTMAVAKESMAVAVEMGITGEESTDKRIEKKLCSGAFTIGDIIMWDVTFVLQC